MAQVIHDVAPGAAIDFYTAFNSEQDFTNGILALAQAGCSIIVDDVTYFDEPFFQETTIDSGVISAAVDAVTAEGVSYFTAASNAGGNFYQASFTPTSVTLPGSSTAQEAEEFSNGSVFQTIALSGKPVVFDLQWDQAFGSADDTALTMELFNSSNSLIATSGLAAAGEPVQLMEPTLPGGGGTYKLAIIWDGQTPAPSLFKYIIYSGYEGAATIEDPAGGTGSGDVIGHEMDPNANTVGAVSAGSVTIDNGAVQSVSLEPFSSVGPGEILFDANGNRLAQPIDPDKINFTAPDGIATSVFPTFFGTSAAAPDAAAVAALMLQANPALSPTQVTDDLAAAAAVMNGGSNTADGAGLVQAPGAVAAALGVVWTSAAGGAWSTATAWAGGTGPTASTPATLSNDFGTLTASYVVLVTNNSAVADTVSIGGTTISVSLSIGAGSELGLTTGAAVGRNGSLTVAAAGSLAVGGTAVLTDPSALLTLQGGAVMTAQALRISAGQVTLGAGASLAVGGTAELDGSSALLTLQTGAVMTAQALEIYAGELELGASNSLAIGGLVDMGGTPALLMLDGAAVMTAQALEMEGGNVDLGTSASFETTGTIAVTLFFDTTEVSVPFGLNASGGTLSLESGAALTVDSGGVFFSGDAVTIASGATLVNNGGTSALAIALDASVTDEGTLTTEGGLLVNTGATVAVAAGAVLGATSLDIEGTGATLDIAGTVNDSGALTGAAPGTIGIENHGTLKVGGSLTGAAIDLSGGGVLDLSTTSSTLKTGFTSVITLANSGGGAIDLAGVPYNHGTNTLRFNNGALAIVAHGTTLADLAFPTGSSYNFTQANDAGALQLGVACYCRGTRIATLAGEKPIEDLSIGDLILTADNASRPLRWIGRRQYAAEEVGKHRHLRPIRIRAGALGSGANGAIPGRDLLVSPEHAIALPGHAGAVVLVPAHLLVNGVSIAREPAATPIEYLHLELGEHDIILAKGAPAESFVDDDSRALFNNAAEFKLLYPNEKPRPPAFCAPRVTGGPALAHVRTRLEGIAGMTYGPLRGFLDRADREMVAGWAHDPDYPDSPVVIEIVVNGKVFDAVLADTFRDDLARLGMAGGYCAFNWRWPRSLDPARRHIVSVRRAGDGAEMPGSPFLLDRRATIETALSDLRFAEPGLRREMADFLADQMEALEARTI